jgi:phage tail-like protein
MTTEYTGPFVSFNFRVQIDQLGAASFSECSGLSSDQAVIEYREGMHDSTVQKLMGLRSFTNILLKRGYTTDLRLWQWRLSVMNGAPDRRNGSIALMDTTRATPLLIWSFESGWPKKWDGPTFNAKSSEIAIETVEIVHEGLRLEGSA